MQMARTTCKQPELSGKCREMQRGGLPGFQHKSVCISVCSHANISTMGRTQKIKPTTTITTITTTTAAAATGGLVT